MGTTINTKSRLTREFQHFFINNEEIPGVQSVRTDYPSLAGHLRYLGMNQRVVAPLSEPTTNFTVNALLISQDQFISLTGNYGVNGYVLQARNITNDNFTFQSGYLTSYTLSYSASEIPRIDAQFQVFGDIGTLTSPNSDVSAAWNSVKNTQSTALLQIPGPGLTQVSFDGIEVNRLQSYQLKIDVPRTAVYRMGSRLPSRIETLAPTVVTCSLRFEVSDFEFTPMLDFPIRDTVESLNIIMRSLEFEQTIATYSFSNLRLISQTFETDIDGNTSAVLNYETFQV